MIGASPQQPSTTCDTTLYDHGITAFLIFPYLLVHMVGTTAFLIPSHPSAVLIHSYILAYYMVKKSLEIHCNNWFCSNPCDLDTMIKITN